MPPADLQTRGAQTMTVCNSCRYCEQFCPVFPAMERRLTFASGDLAFLANLCHNCGECLYACQYAPPHEFGIDVPRTLAELRLRSYEECCWPGPLGVAFRRQGTITAVALASGFTGLLFALTRWINPAALSAGRTDASFYAVMPHGVMVTVFGGVGAFVLLAIGIGMRRFRRAIADGGDRAPRVRDVWQAVRDGVTLRHLHATGPDCVSGEGSPAPWRRWWHHATLGGFLMCFASTSVAALYHSVFGWLAPYDWSSVPVVLGTLGGVGLVVGPMGQWRERQRRDPALSDPAQHGMDDALLVLLWLTSVSGLALLLLRERELMPALLLAHLGIVLTLFVAMPYGKFVHGFYRLLALARDKAEGT